MSDRVAYAAGNTAGRDLVNWPTILRSERATVLPLVDPLLYDEIWPVDITLAQAMALAWRVKKWRLTGSCEVAIDYFDPSGPTQTIIGSGESEFDNQDIAVLSEDALATEIEAATESDLVRRVFDSRYQALVNHGVARLSGDAVIANWSLTFTVPANSASGSTPAAGGLGNNPLSFGMMNGFWLFDPDTQKFAPPFVAIGRVIDAPQGSGGTAGMLVVVSFHRSPVTVLSGTGPLLLRAPGTMTVKPLIAADFTVPLQIGWRLPGEAVGSVVSGTGSADLTLEAVEYWPFADSENLPVYDSATGTQLRDPFS